MTEALIDYGLFLAKTLTLLFGIGFLLLLLVRARKAMGSWEEDRLEIVSLNKRYRSLAHQIKQASLGHKDFLKFLKAENKAKKGADEKKKAPQKRLFVLDFHGDLKATETAELRELITCILLEAQEGDEVLLRLENAGGLVSEHGFAAAQLLRLRRQGLRLTVSVDRVAASGGYLMAAVADRIIAAPFAVLGSIGVVAQLPNFHRVLERHGIEYELHTAGEYKRTLTLFGQNTEEGRNKVREQLEAIHSLFKAFIREHRPHLDLSRVATGEYWHGQQALELGLVDAIETSDDFLLAAARERAIYKIAYHAHKRPLERLLASIQAAFRY